MVDSSLDGGGHVVVRKRKVIKMNPYKQTYDLTQDDLSIVQNPYDTSEDKYVFAKDDVTYNEYKSSYVMSQNENMCTKYNPYTMQYEKVPCDWELQMNPYTGRYEYGPK